MTESFGALALGFLVYLMTISLFNYFYCAITKNRPRMSFLAREEELRDCKLAYLQIMVIVSAVLEIEENILMQLIARRVLNGRPRTGSDWLDQVKV